MSAYHFRRRSTHSLKCSMPFSGRQKYSISICSNSRVRKMKLPVTISLRNDLPICPTPNGSFMRIDCCTFRKFVKMPCAVSGRRYAIAAESSTGPTCVLNIILNCRASVRSHSSNFPAHMLGFFGHGRFVQLVLAEPPLARSAVDQGVIETTHVTARFPDLGRLQNGRIQPDDVFAGHDGVPPPGVGDTPLQLHAQRPVVPGGLETAVDLGCLKDESAPLGEGDNLVEGDAHRPKVPTEPKQKDRAAGGKPAALQASGLSCAGGGLGSAGWPGAQGSLNIAIERIPYASRYANLDPRSFSQLPVRAEVTIEKKCGGIDSGCSSSWCWPPPYR